MPTPYDDCLNEAIVEGVIDEKQRNQFQRAFEAAQTEAARLGKAGPEASNWASAKAIERMMSKVGETKAAIARDIMGTDAAIESVKKTQTVKLPKALAKIFGETNPVYRGLETLFGERLRGWGSDMSVVESQRASRLVLDATLDKLLTSIRSKTLGLTKDRASPLELVKEIFGVDTKDAAAKAHAKAYDEFDNLAIGMLGEQGVKVTKLERHLPLEWSSGKLQTMGQEAFVEAGMERWKKGDWKLRDWEAGGDALLQPGKDDARVAEILGGSDKKPGMWRNVTTNGDAGIQIGMPRGETISQRYNRRRVIEFNSPEAYFDFLDSFGNGRENLGDDLIRHKNRLADDIGMARIMGDNPQKRFDTLMDWGRKEGNLTSGQIAALEKTWFHSSGQAFAPANVALANTAQATRLWLTGTQLDSAMLGSAPDYAFARSVATFNGLNPTRLLGEYLKGPVSARQARQMGLLIEDSGIRGLRDHAGEQFSGSGAVKLAGHAAEAVMRGTGLDAHTTMLRTAVGREFLATLADIADKGWADLPMLNRRFLERYGIDAKAWDLLRAHGMSGERLFMDPASMARTQTGAPREAAMKLLGAVDAESAIAINESSVGTRAFWLGKTQPGTLSGELLRSFQYKGFATSAMLKSGWRMVDSMFDQSGMTPRGRYIAGLAIEATVLGALSLQLKNLAMGKDPESMSTVSFWGKAAAQGGTGGMLGDYVKTMWQTRSTDDYARMLTPTAGLLADTYALTTGNAAQWYDEQKTNAAREAVRYGKKYLMPRLWMTNLAVDRMGWDTLQRMADPDAAGAFHRLGRKLQKDTGQSYFSPPGSDYGDMRMPDVGAAFRARQ